MRDPWEAIEMAYKLISSLGPWVPDSVEILEWISAGR